MSEVEASQEVKPKAKRAPAEVTKVVLSDGRTAEFSGKKRMDKEVLAGSEGQVGLRLDFRNGETRTFWLSQALYTQAAGHGLSQKVGDETAGDEKVEDMVIHVDEILERLGKDEWYKARGDGDSFSGASLVILALMEVSGKTQAEIKASLTEIMEKRGLTRAELFKGFRKPGTKTAAIIKRLEEEAITKEAKADGDELLAEMLG